MLQMMYFRRLWYIPMVLHHFSTSVVPSGKIVPSMIGVAKEEEKVSWLKELVVTTSVAVGSSVVGGGASVVAGSSAGRVRVNDAVVS